jgi:UrcA family protein
MRAAASVGASIVLWSAASAASAEPARSALIIQDSGAAAVEQLAVPYGDLQLASISHQKVLRSRVGMAIAELCDATRFSLAQPHEASRCTRDAWSDVQPRLRQLTPRLASR